MRGQPGTQRAPRGAGPAAAVGGTTLGFLPCIPVRDLTPGALRRRPLNPDPVLASGPAHPGGADAEHALPRGTSLERAS